MEQTTQKKHKRLVVCCQTVDVRHPILGFFVSWLHAFSEDFEAIDVICLEEGTYDLPPHVQIHSLGKEHGASKLRMLVRFYRQFFSLTQSQDVEYVLYHMGAIYNLLAAPFYLLKKLRGGPKYYWWKTHGYINFEGKLALKFVDKIFTASERSFPIKSNKKNVVGHAIDTALFKCKKVNLKPHLLYTGRIMPVKRLEVFLQVLNALQHTDAEVTGEIIGPVGDGVYFKTLKRLANELGFSENVFTQPRPQPELVTAYCRSSVFLNTSRTDSMDKTVLEGILCGCVPVTGNKAFADMLAPHGLYVPSGTVDDYVKVITAIMHKDMTKVVAALQSEIHASHSLETLSNRIFG